MTQRDYYDITEVDIDSRDPNIRGRVGSILHSGTEQDREDFHRMMDEGLTLNDALDRVANNIALRASRITARASDRRV